MSRETKATTNPLLDSFVDHLTFERRLSPRTVDSYASDIRGLLETLEKWEVDPIRAVGPDILREYLAHLHDLGRAASSRQRSRASIRAFYRLLEREGRVRPNPATDLEAPAQGRDLPHVIAVEDIESLLAACAGQEPLQVRDRAMIETAYGAGLRVSELIELGNEDADLRDCWLRVRGKGNKERVVPIGGGAVEALLRYLEGPRSILLGARSDPGTVFLNARGRSLSRMGFWKILRKRAVEAGLPAHRIHPHTLRHSYATHLLHGGASLRVVQELLGHNHLQTTEIYTAVDRDYLRKVHREYHPRG